MEEICVLKQSFLKIQSRVDEFCLNDHYKQGNAICICLQFKPIKKKTLMLEVTYTSPIFIR